MLVNLTSFFQRRYGGTRTCILRPPPRPSLASINSCSVRQTCILVYYSDLVFRSDSLLGGSILHQSENTLL